MSHLAHPGVRSPAALRALSARFLATLIGASPQDCSNFLVASTKLGIANPELYRRVTEFYLTLDDVNTQHMANILWVWAKRRVKNVTLLTPLVDRLGEMADEADVQHCAVGLWAMGQGGLRLPHAAKPMLRRLL